MKQIGFKNFRKFENFPTMDLGDITILVGGNNAGKSTLVKALLLTFDNLRSMNLSLKNLFVMSPKFRLDANNIHNLHIGEFHRALYNEAKETQMEFFLTVGSFSFCITVKGDNNVETIVSKIEVKDISRGVCFVFDYDNGKMSVDIEKQEENEEYALVDFDTQLDELSNLLKTEKSPEKIANINARIKRLRIQRNNIAHSYSKPSNNLYVKTTMVSYIGIANENVIVNQIRSFAHYIDQVPEVADKRSKEYKNELENKHVLQGMQTLFNEIANDLNFVLMTKTVEYIYAHAANQNAIYTTDDKNDYLAQTIRDFKEEHINKGSEEDLFIRKWMGTEGFGIGYDYEINQVLGSAFGVEIQTSEKSDGKVQLADMGMGSIQLMILLFKLTTFISKYKGWRTKPTIVLEEPEQNLHPKVQSLLADLFAELNSKYGFKFIIETHSEYMIRHIQVLTAKLYKSGFDDIPFKVVYFTGDNEKPCYDMGFQRNGKFEKEFGSGFFNVADDAAMELFDLDDEN